MTGLGLCYTNNRNIRLTFIIMPLRFNMLKLDKSTIEIMSASRIFRSIEGTYNPVFFQKLVFQLFFGNKNLG